MRARPGLPRNHRQPGATAASAGPRPASGRIPAGDWDEAFARITASMAQSPPHATGIWPGHGVATTNYGTRISAQLLARFARMHGCQYWSPAMICWGLGAFGLGLTGLLETNTKEDMGKHSQLILLWAREPGQPAEHGAAPARSEAPRRAHRDDRRAPDRGRREVRRCAADPPRHRYRAGAGDAARHLRRAAPRRGLRRAAHAGVRRARGPRARFLAGVGGADHRHPGRTNRRARAPLCGHAAGDDHAGRQLDAQRRQRLAGGARDRVPAGADRQRRHSRRRLRPASRQCRARPRSRRHHGTGPARAGDGDPQPDAGDHRARCAKGASTRCC